MSKLPVRRDGNIEVVIGIRHLLEVAKPNLYQDSNKVSVVVHRQH